MNAESGAATDKSLILDDLDQKFAAFQAFRKSDSEAAENILGVLGAQDDVDRDIVLDLSSRRPLGAQRPQSANAGQGTRGHGAPDPRF